MNRRDMFKLMGLATAATFMTRLPLLPRAEALTVNAPASPWDCEMALMRLHDHEIRARGYCRVVPDMDLVDYGHTIQVRAFFPTFRSSCMVRGVGLYDRERRLVACQKFESELRIIPGQTLETTIALHIDGRSFERRQAFLDRMLRKQAA